jgi:predicted aldo/keto reductase-like oxidoreductase
MAIVATTRNLDLRAGFPVRSLSERGRNGIREREGNVMLYRTLGTSGLKISALSFGSMRWMSERDCYDIVNRGLDLGMNYVDTSTGYVGGKSDRWTANAVRHRRSDMYFSSKSGWQATPSADQVQKTIEERLKLLDLEYFDLYQVWGLGTMEMLEGVVKKGGMLEGIRKAQSAGLIREGLGFTFHGTPEVFKAAVDTGEFVSATVSYHIMNRKEEPLIDYAAEHGVGVIIMNPLAGGVVAMARDKSFDFLCREDTGPSYGALRFLLANHTIATSIVGWASVEHVEENLKALERPEELTEDYRRTLAARMDEVSLAREELCTGCGYCRECPNGFDPARFMEIMRDFGMYGVRDDALAGWLIARYDAEPHRVKEKLETCIECGECLEKCPQRLPIVEEIRRAKAAMGTETACPR